MKIALLAHTLYPIGEPYAGGMEMITHLLAKKLTSLGHEVDLYAAEGSDRELNVIHYIDKEPRKVKGIKKAPDYADRHESYQFAAAFLNIAQQNYDVVHNHTQHYLPILLGEKLDVPLITSFHTPAFEFIQYAFHFIDKPFKQLFTCVSKSLSQVYNAFDIQTKTVYNGIDLNAWDFQETASEDALLWFGRICPEKGTREAIDVAKSLGEKLYLAGPISNEDYYKKYVEEHLDEKQIVYLGHLEHKALNKLIGSCKVTLFLSTWEEPYGLAIAESLACGTPVIAWDKGASPELLTLKTGVLVPENNRQQLEQAVQKSLALNRKDCRSRAEQFCDIDDMVARYLKLYTAMQKQTTRKNMAVL